MWIKYTLAVMGKILDNSGMYEAERTLTLKGSEFDVKIHSAVQNL